MEKAKKLYTYKGPVFLWDTLHSAKFEAETYAESEAKARSNMAYQYKKKYDLANTVKVRLTGRIKSED